MSALLDVILPIFLVLGAGYFSAKWGIMSEATIDGVMKFAQTIALPAMLFISMAKLDLSSAFDPGLLISFYAGVLICAVAGFAAAYYLFKRTAMESVAVGFCACFSNSLQLGLPITERAFGPDALAGNYAIISIHSPLILSVGIALMEWPKVRGQGLETRALSLRILRSIVTQPLVIGIGLGIALNVSGLSLPESGSAAVNMLARAGIPAALFGLGGVLVRYKPEGDMRLIGVVCAISLLLHPTVTWLIGAKFFALGVDQIRSAVVNAAMAPGVNAFIFANIYGVAKRISASAVLLGTVATLFTAWGWLEILP